MTLVVDASILVVLVTDHQHGPGLAARLEQLAAEERTVHAPVLARYEIASAFTRMVATDQLQPETVPSAWSAIESVPISYHATVGVPRVVELALTLQRRSAYDAAYLALALEVGGELWTFDGKLARNAARFGLPVELAQR